MRGRDKLLELVQGQPLLRRQVEIALAATNGPRADRITATTTPTLRCH